MTKKELEAIAKSLIAAAPAAIAAQIPGWDAMAAAVTPAPDPNAKRDPKPLKVEVETVSPPAGATWTAFKSLHVHNGSNGRYYRGKKLDARYLGAIFTAAGFKPEQTAALIARLGL